MRNRYKKVAHFSESKFRQIIKCFSLDLTATETAHLSGISLRSVTIIFDKLRSKIADWCEQSGPFKSVIEVDKSYFGPRRIPGKRVEVLRECKLNSF